MVVPTESCCSSAGKCRVYIGPVLHLNPGSETSEGVGEVSQALSSVLTCDKMFGTRDQLYLAGQKCETATVCNCNCRRAAEPLGDSGCMAMTLMNLYCDLHASKRSGMHTATAEKSLI